METWTKAELNYMRVLRQPCLGSDLQTRDVSAWTRTFNGGTIIAAVPTAVLAVDHDVIHSQKERHYHCKRCRRTFTEARDTPFYRMHKPKWLVVAVVTLLA